MMKYISALALILLITMSGCATTHSVDVVKPDDTELAVERRNLMLGTWFGDSSSKDGGRFMHIVERYKDGIMKIRFKVIDGNGEITEQTEVAYWGISGPVYFTITKGWIENNKFKAANLAEAYFYDAYKILDLSGKEFRYRHFSTGNEYKVRKVEPDFDFPE